MSKQRAIAAVQGAFNTREKARKRIPALQGQSNDVTSSDVSGREGWVYVRVGSDEIPSQALNTMTSRRPGLPVWVSERKEHPGQLEVVGEREVYGKELAASDASRPHHKQHEWGVGSEGRGEDAVYVWLRQVSDCRVGTSSSVKSVTVAQGTYRLKATFVDFDEQTVDLSSYWPTLGYKWALLTLDEAGVVGVAVSIDKLDLNFTDIPAPADEDDWIIAAVRMHVTTTTITDSPDSPNILDYRFTSLVDVAGGVAASSFTDLTDTPGALGTAYQALRMNSGATALEFHDKIHDIPFIIGDGVNEISTGVKAYVPLHLDATIVGWKLIGLESGSIVIDIWKDTWTNSPPTDADSITNGHEPTLSGAQKASDDDLSDWDDVTIASEDVLGFNVDSVTTSTRVTLTLKVKKHA
jgi:hypothetical protein